MGNVDGLTTTALFETFGVDMGHVGARRFLLYVLEVAHSMAAAPGKPCCAKALRFLSDREGVTVEDYCRSMKQGVKPLLEADDAALAYFGIAPKKRTTGGFAVALAARYGR